MLRPPNPHCAVCNQSSALLQVDLARATVQDVIQLVLKEKLSYSDDLALRKESTILYDPDFDDNCSKTLKDLGFASGQVLTVVDEADEPRVDLSLIIEDK